MADVTPIRPDVAPKKWPQKANDLDLEAACHLSCAKAVADLVGTIGNHPEVLEDLDTQTLFVAMDSIVRSIEAAESLNREVWKQLLDRSSEREEAVDA
jgi:hypothetical protein